MESLREQAIFKSPLYLIVLFEICIPSHFPGALPIWYSQGHFLASVNFGSVWFFHAHLLLPRCALAKHRHRWYRAGTCFTCCHLPKLATLSWVSVTRAELTDQQQLPLCLSSSLGEVRLFSAHASLRPLLSTFRGHSQLTEECCTFNIGT